MVIGKPLYTSIHYNVRGGIRLINFNDITKNTSNIRKYKIIEYYTWVIVDGYTSSTYAYLFTSNNIIKF